VSQKLNRALRIVGRWLWEHAEALPIPIEDIFWVERCGQSVATNGTVIRRLGRPPAR
jgi:hypothetical protein